MYVYLLYVETVNKYQYFLINLVIKVTKVESKLLKLQIDQISNLRKFVKLFYTDLNNVYA